MVLFHLGSEKKYHFLIKKLGKIRELFSEKHVCTLDRNLVQKRETNEFL